MFIDLGDNLLIGDFPTELSKRLQKSQYYRERGRRNLGGPWKLSVGHGSKTTIGMTNIVKWKTQTMKSGRANRKESWQIGQVGPGQTRTITTERLQDEISSLRID